MSTEGETQLRALAAPHEDITIPVDAGRAPVGEGLAVRLDPAHVVPSHKVR